MAQFSALIFVLSFAIHATADHAPRSAGQNPGELIGSSACEIPGLKITGDTVILAAGVKSGRRLQYHIDKSGRAAARVDVTVNSDKPAVLLLGAYEPTIWKIRWTEKTKIAAVLASGYHRQVLAGLPPETPTYISTFENKGACEYFYMKSDELSKVNSVAQMAFGKPVDKTFVARDGAVVVGGLVRKQKLFTVDADKCITAKDLKACTQRLKDLAEVDDMKTFRKLWDEVCSEPSFKTNCREETTAKEGATGKMIAPKDKGSVFQVDESPDKVVLFFMGSK